MKRALLAVSAILVLATPVLANGGECPFPFTKHKLEASLQEGDCKVDIKAETDLKNACADLVLVGLSRCDRLRHLR